MSLRVEIKKRLKGFTLEVAFSSGDGTLALLGASGSGKSMTLKCIAGLVSPDEGIIIANGQTLYDSAAGIDLKPQQRDVGYLFQNYALFPNMTVRKNIITAYTGTKENRDEIIETLIKRYQLEEQVDKYPVHLSGGQQQRAALARIFAYEPKVLLLDEPFSALDSFLRESMQAELKRIINEYDGDVILVTHSRDEAYKIAERMVILDGGCPVAEGKVKDVFAHPGNTRAARITGCKNISRIERTGEHSCFALDWGISLETSEIILDDHTYVGLRAHDFARADTGKEPNAFSVDVLDVIEGPFDTNVIVRASGTVPNADAKEIWWITDRGIEIDEKCVLMINPEDIILLRE